MTAIVFDPTAFRAQFPAFADASVYTPPMLQGYFDMGTAYISNQAGNFPRCSLPRQVLALNLMTAHLASLYSQINAGDTPTITTGATIDKITVVLLPPPAPNGWRFWLNQSPYGTQLLALLEAATVGGFFFGAFPTAGALRR